jgi:hypothetical protein
MPLWVRILASAAVGAVPGAILYTLACLLLTAIFAREAFKDGQYAMVFLLSVPYGGLLGGIVGASLALARLDRPASAGWLCLTGGMLLGSLVALIAWAYASTREGGLGDFLTGLVNPIVGAPMLWAVALVVRGLAWFRE